MEIKRETNMRKKRFCKIVTVLFLVLLFSLPLFSIGCKNESQRDRDAETVAAERLAEKEEALLEEKEKERLAKAEEEKQAEEEVSSDEAEISENDNSFPDEPVTYTGSVNGADIILVVDFKSMEVTGSINLIGDDYINATIMDGKINIDTLEINAKYSGTGRLEAEGEDYPVSGTITGKITDDLNLFDGEIFPDIEDTGGTKFTATK